MSETRRFAVHRSDIALRILVGSLAALFPAGCGEDAPAGEDRSPAPAAAPHTRTPDTSRAAPGVERPLVVFLGDSVSSGLGVTRAESFPSVLEKKLAAAGLPIRLVNAGASGDTTAGGVTRLDWLLRQEPRILVVELGGNDALRGQPLAQIESNLRRIVDRATDRGCRVLLLGMRVPPSYGQDYSEGFASVYERLGEMEDVELVPFFMKGVGGVAELNLPDGIHPTARGHELLAEAVFPALRRLVEEVDAMTNDEAPNDERMTNDE